jgi:hypothetical protein
MAITDINISEELQTGAPPIKYEGNEGPQDPRQERALALLKEEYMQYVFEQKEIDEPVMSFEEWYQSVYQASKMGVQAPREQITTEETMVREPAAFGGIMDRHGRRRYGIGSKLKRAVRKIIPNEVADVAVKAAPFVAPFNPIAAGLMSGIGGFDQHGSLSRGLKSGLMTYGGGQLARGIGGGMENLQTGFNPMGGMQNTGTGAFSKYFSNPIQDTGGLGQWLDSRKAPVLAEDINVVEEKLPFDWKNKKAIQEGLKKGTSGIMDFINKNSTAILLGSMGIAAATASQEDVQEAMRVSRGTGMDIDKIRAEVQEAFESGEEAWNELKKKYPYIGDFSTKKAEGGIMRSRYYSGGQSIPSEYTVEDARKTAMQDKLGGITDIMKKADLDRQGDIGQFYAANGGRIGYDAGGQTGHPPITTGQISQLPNQMPKPQTQQPHPMPAPQPNRMAGMPGGMHPMMNPMARGMNPMMARGMNPMMARGMNPMMGGRRMAQEGGLMDLGGMEKDYRNEGGFVPIGKKEKADDVPARLSVNEFVFTADAVRGAGGGDIDKGAEIMENVMKNLEKGGRISEESQGLQGAREMFEVSERLSEVV